MYEKTVAGIHKIYRATGTGGFTSVWDALPSDAQDEITDLLTNTGAPQYESHDPVEPHRQNVRRLIVDGYLRHHDQVLNVATDPAGTYIETLQIDEIYPTPVVNWIYNTYVSTTGTYVVRIFFS